MKLLWPLLILVALLAVAGYALPNDPMTWVGEATSEELRTIVRSIMILALAGVGFAAVVFAFFRIMGR